MNGEDMFLWGGGGGGVGGSSFHNSGKIPRRWLRFFKIFFYIKNKYISDRKVYKL